VIAKGVPPGVAGLRGDHPSDFVVPKQNVGLGVSILIVGRPKLLSAAGAGPARKF